MNLRQISLRVVSFLVITLAALPTHAAALNAGLVDGVWFSAPEVFVGDPVALYAAVLNQSTTSLSGVVTFYDNEIAIGNTPFAAAPDSISRVMIVHSFPLGWQPISARVTQEAANHSVTYVSLAARPLLVTARPITVVPPAPVSLPGTEGTSGGSQGSGTPASHTPLSSSTSATSTRATGSALGTVVSAISSATHPFATSLTTSRDTILRTAHASTTVSRPSSPLDVVTPTKNLFDVTVEIAGSGNHLSWMQKIWVFFLTFLIWILYCLIPLCILLLILFITRRFRRKYD